MGRSTARVAMAGCLTLAALGAVAALDVGSPTADAAPSVSPFAGTYVGADPRGWYSAWTVTISNRGQITSSFGGGGDRTKGSIGGEVGADGSYSLTVTITTASYDDGPRDPRVPRSKQSYDSAGSLAPDADGDIDGTEDTGRTFSWLRQ